MMTIEETKQFLAIYLTKENLTLTVEEMKLNPVGRVVFNKKASSLIRDEFEIKLDDELYPMDVVVPLMIDKEKEKRRLADKSKAAAASLERARIKGENQTEFSSKPEVQEVADLAQPVTKEQEDIEKVINIIKRDKDKDIYTIAGNIMNELPELGVIIIKTAIRRAGKTNIIDFYKELEQAYSELININSIFNRMINIKNSAKDNRELINNLTREIVLRYRSRAAWFGNMKRLLDDEQLDLSQEIINECVDRFYNEISNDIVARYTRTELSPDDMVADILKQYQDLNIMQVITSLALVKDPMLDIESITYLLFLNDEFNSMLKVVKKPNLSIAEYTIELIDLDLEYPDWCVERFLKQFASNLPIDKIYNLYSTRDRKKDVKPVEQQDDIIEPPMNGTLQGLIISDNANEETSLSVISPRTIAKLPDLEEKIEAEERTEWTVISKREAITKIDKKKSIAHLLVGAGVASVMLLVSVFKINPIEAAQNCIASMGDLDSFNLSQFLPSAAQLTSVFAAAGTTMLGVINHFRYLNKKEKLLDGPDEVILNKNGKISEQNFERRR